jgi:zinc protease
VPVNRSIRLKEYSMKKHGKLAPLAFGILLGLGLACGGSQAAFAADAPAASAAQNANVTRATLDNGLRVVIVRDTRWNT